MIVIYRRHSKLLHSQVSDPQSGFVYPTECLFSLLNPHGKLQLHTVLHPFTEHWSERLRGSKGKQTEFHCCSHTTLGPRVRPPEKTSSVSLLSRCSFKAFCSSLRLSQFIFLSTDVWTPRSHTEVIVPASLWWLTHSSLWRRSLFAFIFHLFVQSVSRKELN